MAAHVPREVLSLDWIFPIQYERDWVRHGSELMVTKFRRLRFVHVVSFQVVSWQPEFCHESMSMAVLICGVYCALCFIGRRIMRDFKPFQLKGPLALWNLGLAVFSAIGASRTVPFLLINIYKYGIYDSVCAPPTPNYGRGPAALWIVLFIFSKVPELADTVFIVLRKKPLIFLHWYHHITVLLFCWHAFGTRSASGIYFIAMNYSVHAVMYFYYFLTACGYRPRWARLVTIFQLSQMGVGVAVCGLNVYYMKHGYACSVDPESLKWGIIMYSSYFALFLKFFVERYLLRSAKKAAVAPAKKAQ